MREETEHDGETTQLAATEPEHDEIAEVPSLADQHAQRRHRRGLVRDLQRPARKAGAA